MKIRGSAHDFNDYAIDYTNGQSISGVQRKLLMKPEGKMLNPTALAGQYIVKPAPDEALHLPEHLSLFEISGY